MSRRQPHPSNLVIQIDPSLFTAPYDAALSAGLKTQGIDVRWLTRPWRAGEDAIFSSGGVTPFFYRRLEQVPLNRRGRWWKIRKGIAHLFDNIRLIALVRRERPKLVHFQWAVLPLIDMLVIRVLRLSCPVVLTVHDTTPFNGERVSRMQNMAFDLPIHSVDRVIVHLQSARQTLIDRGIDPAKIRVIPHGPLGLGVPMPRETPANRPWTIVLFGQLKPYKGLDILVEAAGRLDDLHRKNGRIVIAGAAFMEMEPITMRVKALGLTDMIDLRLGRLSEPELAALLTEANCFVFPYRQIDASGAYFMVSGLGKWIIASNVGVFGEDISDGVTGRLCPAEDIESLAQALEESIGSHPIPGKSVDRQNWTQIGAMTKALYDELG